MVNDNIRTSVQKRPAVLVKEREEFKVQESRKRNLGAKILVVDDEPEIVIAIAMRLKSAGYNVITACDGIEATRLAIHQNPDVIVLDIGMPCGDGHTIANRLANTVATMMKPVIFLTARTGKADREKAMSVSAFDYITKPFTADRLLDAVEAALDSCNVDNEPL